MSIAVILFDLDGTLVDHESAARTAAAQWCAAQGDPGPAAVQRWMDCEQRHFARYERGELTHHEQRIARVRDFLHAPDLPEATATALFADFLAAYAAAWRAFPDAHPAVRAAHATGARVGILTNGATALQRDKLLRTGFAVDRLLLLSSTDMGVAKPDPRIYHRAVALLGVPAAEVLMIGDHPDNDVAAARAAGLRALHLDRAGVIDTAAGVTPTLECIDYRRGCVVEGQPS